MRRAFTLIEMLVVIGIVGTLLGIMLPTLAGIRGNARSVQCMSNLRQLVWASRTYVNIYDAYPPAVRYEDGDDGFTTIAWDYVQHADGSVTPGMIWQHADEPGHVHQCPDYHGPSNFGVDPHSGYNYNTTYIGGEGRFPFTGWTHVRPGLPIASFRRTGRCALFGDGGYAGGANKFMRAPTGVQEGDLWTAYGGGQAFRHLGSTNIAYLDGHVAPRATAYEGGAATESLLAGVLGFPENGFLSDDDSAYDPR